MRYLGIDYGSKHVGIALSDERGTMGFPYSVLPQDVHLMEQIRAIIAKEEVSAVVMGESRDFSGAHNPIAEAARSFGERLASESGVPVFFEAEFLTTQEARRTIDGSRATGPHARVDDAAAALILTSYLSRSHGNH